ncbi:MAG: hypothetical protein M1482_03660, partial [Chloroflexi bacterium]|nr:hypothetical protein [Chloroflexota bacterium]
LKQKESLCRFHLRDRLLADLDGATITPGLWPGFSDAPSPRPLEAQGEVFRRIHLRDRLGEDVADLQ